MEKRDKRFGFVAVELGFITTEHLFDALKTQVIEEMETGKRQLIGQILYKKGYITSIQIDEVLLYMGISWVDRHFQAWIAKIDKGLLFSFDIIDSGINLFIYFSDVRASYSPVISK